MPLSSMSVHFTREFLTTIIAKDSGEPSWLNPWFHTWYPDHRFKSQLFAVIGIVIESLIALSLIVGAARRLNYFLAAIFSFLLWGVAEAFGGPYVSGTTDLNAGIIYVFVFIALYIGETVIPPSWSLDSLVAKKISWWPIIADPMRKQKVTKTNQSQPGRKKTATRTKLAD